MNALTVADLTEEHIGWYMKIDTPPVPGSLLHITHKHIELGGIRRWEYQGLACTGLLDVSTKGPGIVGTERQFSASAKVELIRQIKKPRRRTAK